MKKIMSIAFTTLLCMMMVLTPVNDSYAQVTAEDIIASAKAAMDDPFGELGLKRIDDANALVQTELPVGHPLRVALEGNLLNARKAHDCFEDITGIWIILGNAGWQTKYTPAINAFKEDVAYLEGIFGAGGFVANFNVTAEDLDRIYVAFNAVDLAQVQPTPTNIADAEEKTSKIMNQAVVKNLNARIAGIKGGTTPPEESDFYIISID